MSKRHRRDVLWTDKGKFYMVGSKGEFAAGTLG